MRAPVSAPALREARYGLVKSAERGDIGGRWEDGVAFTPHGCHVIFGHAPGCIALDDPNREKAKFQECSLVEIDNPWLLETGLVWSTADLAANPKELVRETLEVGTSSVLERLTEVGITQSAPGTPIEANFPVQGPVPGTSSQVEGRLMGGVEPPTFEMVQLLDPGPYTATQAFGHVEAKLLDASDHTGSAGTLLMSPVHAVDVWGLLDPSDGGLCSKVTGSTVIIGNFLPGKIWGVVGDIEVYLV